MKSKGKKNKKSEKAVEAAELEQLVSDDGVIESADDVVEAEIEMSDESAELEGGLEADASAVEELEGSELEGYESEDIEVKENLDESQICSILESVLFATDRPQSLATIKQAFRGTQVITKDLRAAIQRLNAMYAQVDRGVYIEEVSGGYQLRTKMDNMKFLRNMIKTRVFKLSGPALEVLSIAAYKQPITKFEIDQIRGVDSGHLLRGLMERNLISFAGKSELPGKPMQYATTRKFLEIFGLRHLDELPSMSDIDQLIPDGIGDVEDEKPVLSDVTAQMSEHVTDASYSKGEEELLEISDLLHTIDTSTQFFEDEKKRQREKRDAEKAQAIRESIVMGDDVPTSDKRWLDRYEKKMNPTENATAEEVVVETVIQDGVEVTVEASAESVTDLAAAAASFASAFNDSGESEPEPSSEPEASL